MDRAPVRGVLEARGDDCLEADVGEQAEDIGAAQSSSVSMTSDVPDARLPAA